MYKQFKGLNLPEIDKEILSYWDDNDIFKKSIETRNEHNSFVFYEGPPSANGKPGIHHVIARTVKDLFCRFHTMQGKRVERKGGWDTHGLPIELSVEKELGITKDDIGTKISIAEYNAKCREMVMRYKDLWDDITRKMGYWVDLENPYITFQSEYIESVWYLINQLYEKGLMYKGYTVQPFSPAAGTGLSTHELNMPGAYRDVKDISAVAQFKLLQSSDSQFLFDKIQEGDIFCLAWTTTPWTLPSNTALAVGKKIKYVLVETFNAYTKIKVNLVLAHDLITKWFTVEQLDANIDEFNSGDKIIPVDILHTFTGSELESLRYEQLLPYVQPEEGDAFKILLGDFVSTEDGTGVVHIAPSFGADDMKIGKANGMGALTLVDSQGKFVDEVTDFAGRYVKDYTDDPNYENVDIDIVTKLKKENRLFNSQKYSHNYPHCWRTDKPVLYYPMDSWFIRSSSMKERMAELNRTINWKPSHTGEKRFGNWLDNLQDWNLSRSRFWGIPLPIWRTKDESQEICIGSVAQLAEEIEKANTKLGLNQAVPDDLHRPFIDDVILCSEDGQEMRRELDLIDVWFDSGSMPYAQWHYPFENKEKFKQNFPADFIAEGVDQTRGWFFTLHAIAVMVFDKVAFKNVLSNGLVQDKHGRKMSKRIGNAAEPFQTIAKYGADAVRWYMISNAQPWDNLKFDTDGIEEVRRKFFGTLYNTYSFYALYANIDQFDNPSLQIEEENRPEIDRWIISKLNSLVQDVEAEYFDYEPTNATRRIQDFVDNHLSNWYVRLCRRRFWKGEYTEDKISAYQTLYRCLVTLSKLMAPVAPFFADWLFKNLNDITDHEYVDSVHLSLFPIGEDELIDKALEERMGYAQTVSSLVLSLRKKEKIRVRQPLPRILIPIIDQQFKTQLQKVENLIKAEVNVKEIDYVDDATSVIKKKAKPNFKTLGRRLGKDMKMANQIISSLGDAEIQRIEETGAYTLIVGDVSHDLSLEDIVIVTEDLPGWHVAQEGRVTVALDTKIDDMLLAEGTARELVNRIQNIRKGKDFDVTDKINVRMSRHEKVVPAIEHFKQYICKEVLAANLLLIDDVTGEEVDLFEDTSILIEVEKA